MRVNSLSWKQIILFGHFVKAVWFIKTRILHCLIDYWKKNTSLKGNYWKEVNELNISLIPQPRTKSLIKFRPLALTSRIPLLHKIFKDYIMHSNWWYNSNFSLLSQSLRFSWLQPRKVQINDVRDFLNFSSRAVFKCVQWILQLNYNHELHTVS